jgi:hypothetical protein
MYRHIMFSLFSFSPSPLTLSPTHTYSPTHAHTHTHTHDTATMTTLSHSARSRTTHTPIQRTSLSIVAIMVVLLLGFMIWSFVSQQNIKGAASTNHLSCYPPCSVNGYVMCGKGGPYCVWKLLCHSKHGMFLYVSRDGTCTH